MKTKNKTLISVIMPAHNAQEYIGGAIESILTQTFKKFELIIVNDSSTDNTSKIIKSYSQKDSRIRIVNNHQRLNIAKTLNKGIALAKSDIIARMDADDISFPSRLELQYRIINNNKKVAVVGANVVIMNKGGNQMAIRRYPHFSKELKKCLFRYSPFAHPVVMFRKKLFDKVDGYDSKYSPTEDLDLWFKLGRKYEFASIKEPLLKYRIDEKSSSHIGIKNLEMLVFKIRLKAIIKYGFRPSLYDTIYNLFQFITLWFTPAKYRIKIYNLLRNNSLI